MPVTCTRCNGTMLRWEVHGDGWCPDCILEMEWVEEKDEEGEEEQS